MARNALTYTVTIQAVQQIIDHRAGSVLTLLVTAFVITYAVQAATDRLRRASYEGTELTRPFFSAAAFVAATFVNVGISMQSNLLGTYLAGLFTAGIHPLFIITASTVGLTLLWVLGRSVGAVQ